jgi:hypothetical protein
VTLKNKVLKKGGTIAPAQKMEEAQTLHTRLTSSAPAICVDCGLNIKLLASNE